MTASVRRPKGRGGAGSAPSKSATVLKQGTARLQKNHAAYYTSLSLIPLLAPAKHHS